MHLGFSTMNNLQRARPDDLARVLEECGYESLWIGEHSHIPVSRKTPYPAGGEMPEQYKHMADPFIAIAMAAAVTKKLRFGTSVTLLLERDIFTLAKEVATLDQLCGGRLTIGIGVGWNQEEFENVAKMPWNKRYSGMKECAAALRALWTQDEAEYQGEWYRFDKVWSYPKPLQKPHPPLTLGVAGRLGMAHAAEWGDGWHPLDIGTKDFGPRLERFRQMVRDGGRDPAKIEVTVVNMGEPNADRLRRYAELGVTRAVIGGAAAQENLGETRRYAERYAKLAAELAA
jgi:probable F420-dependent oxidoreductase